MQNQLEKQIDKLIIHKVSAGMKSRKLYTLSILFYLLALKVEEWPNWYLQNVGSVLNQYKWKSNEDRKRKKSVKGILESISTEHHSRKIFHDWKEQRIAPAAAFSIQQACSAIGNPYRGRRSQRTRTRLSPPPRRIPQGSRTSSPPPTKTTRHAPSTQGRQRQIKFSKRKDKRKKER